MIRKTQEENPLKAATPVTEGSRHDSDPSYEDFADWCDSPVTRFVARKFLTLSDYWKAVWFDNAWDSRKTPEELLEYKLLSETYLHFIQSTLDHYKSVKE